MIQLMQKQAFVFSSYDQICRKFKEDPSELVEKKASVEGNVRQIFKIIGREGRFPEAAREWESVQAGQV